MTLVKRYSVLDLVAHAMLSYVQCSTTVNITLKVLLAVVCHMTGCILGGWAFNRCPYHRCMRLGAGLFELVCHMTGRMLGGWAFNRCPQHRCMRLGANDKQCTVLAPPRTALFLRAESIVCTSPHQVTRWAARSSRCAGLTA